MEISSMIFFTNIKHFSNQNQRHKEFYVLSKKTNVGFAFLGYSKFY